MRMFSRLKKCLLMSQRFASNGEWNVAQDKELILLKFPRPCQIAALLFVHGLLKKSTSKGVERSYKKMVRVFMILLWCSYHQHSTYGLQQ